MGSTPMDGRDGGIDRRIHLHGTQHGTFYRSDDETVLVMGTFRQPSEVETPIDEFYGDQPSVRFIRGLEGIYSQLSSAWRPQQATLAIRDFYPYWFSKQEDASAGKLLAIDESDRDVAQPVFLMTTS
ncbi:hypothetical protein PINS_up023465 [Pythium insidiosum]|nr:hypothetical protein PINS_up023465 [Pythium insidiosum]